MTTNIRGRTIVADETYNIDGSYRPIFVNLDDEGYITVYDDNNSYSGYFHVDEYVEYYNLLEQAHGFEEYDEEDEEYYYPDEVDLSKDNIGWNFDVTFKKDYKGNWIIRDRIYKIQKAVKDFKDKYAKPLTIDDIKSMMSNPSKLSLSKLMQIVKTLKAIKEAKDGARTTK